MFAAHLVRYGGSDKCLNPSAWNSVLCALRAIKALVTVPVHERGPRAREPHNSSCATHLAAALTCSTISIECQQK